jgi:hypothetical protein
MITQLSRWLLVIFALFVVVGSPFLGNWARRTSEHHCALDDATIQPAYRVRVVDHLEQSHEFCCLRCAELWLKHQSAKPMMIQVTDESSGDEIDASTAFFVRSLVVTTPTTGNRIHVFATRARAEKHAAQFGGRLLQDGERPLVRRE